MEFEAVIGLEVHAQLLTQSKLFCACSTRFGASPNANTCPVCLGLPGALPVLNRQAVAMAVKAGLALGCRINQESLFARKNYFYPDLPKGYQISQYDLPVAEKGEVALLSGERLETGQIANYRRKTFGIHRVHLEDDAGKSIHVPGGDTYVNLNRTGVPLIEIVSEADFRSSQEAYDYMSYLRRTLLYLGICDGNMEEGSLRCDANVSVRPVGSSLFGTKVEIKNLNSFRFLQKALDYEIQRQIEEIRKGGQIFQETRLWDEERNRTLVMRSKEEAHDYRYFPEPDLMPVLISSEWLEQLQADIPELPEPRRLRLAEVHGLSDEDALTITQTRELADYFEGAVAAYPQPKVVFNWLMGEVARHLKQENQSIQEFIVRPEQLAGLVRMVEEGKISGKMAKDVFDQMCKTGRAPEEIVQAQGLRQISDENQLEQIIDRVLSENAQKVEAYRAGKSGLLGFFVGQVMRQTKGQANPQVVNRVLRDKLESSS